METGIEQLEGIFTRDRKDRSQLISLLRDIQDRLGYLSPDAMLRLAQFLEIAPADVYGVATFYSQFRFKPIGKRHIRICAGTACHLAGGQLVQEAIERELEIKVGNVTGDEEFSLERVACIGCCAVSPVITINKRTLSKLTPSKMEEIILLEKGRK